MSVTVCMPLFGSPDRELERGAKSNDLRALADSLRERLLEAADTVDRLTAGGWSTQVAMFDLMLSHPKVDSREKAESRLRDIGIEPANFLIIEDLEEDDAD